MIEPSRVKGLVIVMMCSHCGKELDNDKLSFCVYCGYPLKGSKQGFFAKSEKTGVSRADELVRSESPSPEPAPKRENPTPQAAPVQPVPPAPQQQPAMQQMAQPVMNGMPQMGVAGMPVPPIMPAQGVAPVQGGMMPNMPQMGMPQMMGAVPPQPVQPAQNPAEMGSMPQQPYGMPQMVYGMPQMYGMPQFAGYDAAGNPIYMQMVPQFMGYDTYGNPLYNMVAMPMVMPNMQGMPAAQPVQPMMQQMYPQPEAVIELQQEQVQMTEAAPAPQPAQAALQEPQTDFEERQAVIASSDDIPINADSLIEDEEQAKPEVPDEKALLDRIFSDAPKNYSMSEGTAPSAAVFSISIGANEITNIRDEEAPAPTAPKAPRKAAAPAAEKPEKKAAKPEKPEKTEKIDKAASKKKPAQKKPATIVSPDDFFNDKPRTPRGTINVAELDSMDDEQLAAHLAKQQAAAGKRSTRTMKAASREEMDISNIDVESVLTGKNQFPQ